jgi:exodeoxyribonuclease VII large subunit
VAIYSVSQVVSYLKEVLAYDPVLRDLWVTGEVANLARPASGHSYFSLRDQGTTLRCVMFRTAFGAELLSDGAAVIAHGSATVYEVRGDLQLIVDVVRPEGVGELQLKFEQLRLTLEREGLFDTSRKRPVPKFPNRIGVVTSPTGAVWQDIQTVIARRYPLVELVLAPTGVQGDGAADGIVEALAALQGEPGVDVVIVARGGGSLEDLWPFNEEAVARAIFASQVPIITGVGHETDVTIADLAADRRAPTPSAAAELAVPDRIELLSGLAASKHRMGRSASARLLVGSQAVSRLADGVRRGRPDLDGLRLRIDDALDVAVRRLVRTVESMGERAEGLKTRLDLLSPRDTLRRGYAIVQTPTDSEVVSDSAQVQAGDRVLVTLARGGFGAEVTSTETDGDASEPTPSRG